MFSKHVYYHMLSLSHALIMRPNVETQTFWKKITAFLVYIAHGGTPSPVTLISCLWQNMACRSSGKGHFCAIILKPRQPFLTKKRTVEVCHTDKTSSANPLPAITILMKSACITGLW